MPLGAATLSRLKDIAASGVPARKPWVSRPRRGRRVPVGWARRAVSGLDQPNLRLGIVLLMRS